MPDFSCVKNVAECVINSVNSQTCAKEFAESVFDERACCKQRRDNIVRKLAECTLDIAGYAVYSVRQVKIYAFSEDFIAEIARNCAHIFLFSGADVLIGQSVGNPVFN